VNWVPGPGANTTVDRYVIRREVSQSGTLQWRGAPKTPVTSFTDRGGLEASVRYQITPRSASGESAPTVSCSTLGAGGTKLLAVGDLVACDLSSTPGAEAVSDMLGQPKYANTDILMLGDLAYPGGSVTDFGCFHDTFGMHKDRMWPMPGNHEYGIGAVNPRPWAYINYFRNRADFDNGFAVCSRPTATSSTAPSQAGTNTCRLVAWHHPYFWTPKAGDPISTQANQRELMELLADTGTDLILAGHTHKYERFEPQTIDATASPTGFQLMSIGTGGRVLNPFEDPQVIAPNSALRVYEFGLAEFELSPQTFSWTFETINGDIPDQGTRGCKPKSLPS